MIRTRRLTHRYVFFCLAFLIPTLLLLGLAFRPDIPPFSQFDPALLSKAGFTTNIPNQVTRIQAGEHTFEIAVEEDSATMSSLIIRSVEPLLKPDLLVYWAAEPSQNISLPENAILLGELMGQTFRRMPFPKPTATDQGTLVIYSLGHQEVFTQFLIPNLVGTGKGTQA